MKLGKKPFFTRKRIGRLLFAAASLAALLALIVLEENWRGKRDWEAFARAHEAHGERIDIKAFVPPPVPDAQNFAMTPLLAPIFNGGDNSDTAQLYAARLRKKLEFPKVEGKPVPKLGDRATGKYADIDEWKDYLGADVLEWLKKLEPELNEISGAAGRPYSRFSIRYEKGVGANLPHITILRDLAKLYQLRASAELHAGLADAALSDVLTIFRLEESMRNEPFLVSHVVRPAILQGAVQVVWEGLDEHRWTDAQLQTLQEELARADFLKGLALAYRGERAAVDDIMLSSLGSPQLLARMMSTDGEENNVWVFRFIPQGWLYQNLLELNRFYETAIFPSVDVAGRRIHPEMLNQSEQAIAEAKHSLHLYKIWEALIMPAFTSVGSKVAYEQATTDQALIACALERYRLAHGEFPDALAKLVPDFLKEIPANVTDGSQPHYRLNKDGTFLLYSNGWDGKDHGGDVIVSPVHGTIDVTKGDWVWTGKPE